jgi:hypothetical protein
MAEQWNPTIIKNVLKNNIESSTSPILIVTDQGRGYFKALGNREGPHVLACEYVGTSLAKLLGLQTFEFCLFNFDGTTEIKFSDGTNAQLGYGFLAKEESGLTWDGKPQLLETVINKSDFTKLVCLDTWVRNQDRYFPHSNKKIRKNFDNVFLSKKSKNKTILKAFDFTHAFTNGREITNRIIQEVKDDSIFGLFPEFKIYLNRSIATNFCKKLKTIKKEQIRSIINSIPQEWDINLSAREAWIEFILGRAIYVANNFIKLLYNSQNTNYQQQFLFDKE